MCFLFIKGGGGRLVVLQGCKQSLMNDFHEKQHLIFSSVSLRLHHAFQSRKLYV